MGRSSAALTVIIASFVSYNLRAQDTVGVYFSARGFSFDDYYRKAVLTSEEENLSGKAAFLLLLADTLATYIAAYPHQIGLNLHRYPAYREYIETPRPLPTGWQRLIHIQHMELRAVPQKAIVARSNRLHTERFYILSSTVKGIIFGAEKAEPFSFSVSLPPTGWRQALIQALVEEIKHLL
ncbi:MAG: hypothetical protein ABDH66_06290 [Bacteroidia bacterium]